MFSESACRSAGADTTPMPQAHSTLKCTQKHKPYHKPGSQYPNRPPWSLEQGDWCNTGGGGPARGGRHAVGRRGSTGLADTGREGDTEGDALAEACLEGDADGDAVDVEEGAKEGLGDADAVDVEGGEREGLGDAEAPSEREVVGEADTGEDPVTVGVRDDDIEREVVDVLEGLLDTGADSLRERDNDFEREGDGDRERVGEDVRDEVGDEVCDEEGEELDVRVRVPQLFVGEGDGLADRLG